MINIDLEKENPELADLVLEVARECDSSLCDGGRLDISQIKININIPGLEEVIEEIKKNNERKIEQHKQLKDTIKSMIKGDALLGYAKAFELCGDIDNESTRTIKYEVYKKIPYLSDLQKIDICKKYAEINNSEKVIDEIARLQYEAMINGEEIIASDVYDNFRRAYEMNEYKRYYEARMIGFYKVNKTEKGIVCWQNIFSLLIENTYEKNIGFWGRIVFDILISQKKFEQAERFLDNWELNEIATTLSENIFFNEQLSFIESCKQRMKYLQKGYSFMTDYTEIRCYDNIDGNKKILSGIKSKYKDAVAKHREYLTFKEIYQKEIDKSGLEDSYIAISEEEIEILPSLLEYLNEIEKVPVSGCQYYFENRYKIFGAPFKELSIYYQKNGRINDAIRICKKGISCGYTDDGTKYGMKGRLMRLLKIAEKNLDN